MTGAASGIGAATARRLSAEGGAVVLADLDEARGRAVCDEITASGGVASFEPCDVADAAAWRRTAGVARERWLARACAAVIADRVADDRRRVGA